MKLCDDFDRIVEPWCEKNQYSLHEAFENSRKRYLKNYKILSDLWSTYFGKEYLRSVFHSRCGRLRKQKSVE